MIFDFLRLEKRINKADNKMANAVKKALEVVEDLTKTNNELETMSSECKMKSDHYSNVNANIEKKIASNNSVIEQIKKISTTSNEEIGGK